MSTPYPHLTNRVGGGHPTVTGRRARESLVLGVTFLVPVIIALAISIQMPSPTLRNVVEVIVLTLGIVGVIALVLSTRYTVTLTILALYLGMLDGPIKLESTSRLSSGFRDILIGAIGLGMLMRLGLKRERVTLPPLAGWVLAFVAVVLVEALNPRTGGLLKAVGGYRQQLEFVPFFFFAYLIMRSKQRFRQLFLILGVIALANGVVGTVQSRLSPAELARWGPGYNQRLSGNGGGRTFKSEGESHPRPLALGSDSGFGGGVGVLAMPGLVALMMAGGVRRRWPVVVCSLGALAGIATSASRTTVISLVVALASYAALAMFVRLKLSRALLGLMVVGALAVVIGAGLVAAEGGGIFKRQESLPSVVSSQVPSVVGGQTAVASEGEEESEAGGDAKTKHLSQIPGDIAHEPLGLGLGSAGSVAGFGGKVEKVIEEQKVSGGSAYNLLAVELGLPGLLLWIGLTINVFVLVATRLRRVVDPELRTYLVAVVASFVAVTVQGLGGPTLAVSPAGIYLWFVPGVIAYWLAGAGRSAMAPAPAAAHPAASLAVAS
jgi:hypothetical protein